ncbi:MAG: endonuclease/exonuclease/phosphatase family protein [Chloroflexi bacterium]|nr:endonuclease/exonuclease/phosphatase family protein [Chloroflexota bacterium]MCI0647684.1 endonuclease/exonuclease/phosphatase family protein [Chloroflexota bacterium]
MALLNRGGVPYLFVPAPLALGLAVRSRQKKVVVLALAPLLIFARLYGAYFVPRPARPADPPDLRVMSYNVLFANNDVEAVVQIVERYRPDLLALQEVRPRMMSELSERLADSYPYAMAGEYQRYQERYGTTAAFSRYPLLARQVLDLGAERQAIVLRVIAGEHEVVFIAAHLLAYNMQFVPLGEWPQAANQRVQDQNEQAQRILAEGQREPADVFILACDCNSQETASSYLILAEYLTNTARSAGWRWSQAPPAGAGRDHNLLHIDYIFYRGPVTATGVYTVDNKGGSDHRAVVADFEY